MKKGKGEGKPALSEEIGKLIGSNQFKSEYY
jgi:hypothetical protein